MNEKNYFALVPKPLSAVEKAQIGAKRILACIVDDTLKLAQRKLAVPLDTSAASKGFFQEGERRYWGNGVLRNRNEAIEWYRKAAEYGNTQAQYRLGRCYRFGIGVPQDFIEAAKWFRKAAEQGDRRGECSLGLCYAQGRGVPQDDGEAVKWYRKAAEQGDACGAQFLSECYKKGRGVPKDYAEAEKWSDKSGEYWAVTLERAHHSSPPQDD